MRKAIQLLEPFELKADAVDALAALRLQDGYMAGRVLDPAAGKPGYRVQAFFQDDTDGPADGWLPDGCRRVLIPDSLARVLGIEK